MCEIFKNCVFSIGGEAVRAEQCGAVMRGEESAKDLDVLVTRADEKDTKGLLL